MGRINTIQVGRLNRLVQKLLSMKGPATLDTLSPELMPVISIFHGAEDRYIESWYRYGQTFHVVASVGNNSVFQIRDPAGSNVVGIVEKLVINVETVADLVILEQQGPDATVGGAESGGSRLDKRGQQNSTLLLSGANGVAAQTAMGGVQLLLNTSYDFILDVNQELTILPGDNLRVRTVANNNGLRVGLIWRERFLEDSERA